MKYQMKFYARALADALARANSAEETERFAGNFIRLVRKNGDERRLRAILEQTEGLLLRGKGGRKVTIETARKLSRDPKTLFANFLSPADAVEEKIDSGLVAGVKITIDGEMRFDVSLKRKLDRLFDRE